MINFGSSKIFKSTGGTFKDEDIDIILKRGELKTEENRKKI